MRCYGLDGVRLRFGVRRNVTVPYHLPYADSSSSSRCALHQTQDKQLTLAGNFSLSHKKTKEQKAVATAVVTEAAPAGT